MQLLFYFCSILQDFPNYGLGFLRYERDEKSRHHVIWEQKDLTIRPLDDPKLKGKYGSVRMPHQGMYMATREQLLLWKKRCQFDQIDPENQVSHSIALIN